MDPNGSLSVSLSLPLSHTFLVSSFFKAWVATTHKPALWKGPFWKSCFAKIWGPGLGTCNLPALKRPSKGQLVSENVFNGFPDASLQVWGTVSNPSVFGAAQGAVQAVTMMMPILCS